MKKLEVEKMEKIEGGLFDGWGSSGCNDAMIGLGVAVASSFFGPAGIVSGVAGFATFVNHIGDCSTAQ